MKNICIIIMLLGLILILTSCSYINSKLGWSDDNVAEKVVESVIEGKLE